jgi:hypothetical protein
MSGLSSVILTSVKAASTAANRVQTSAQIRNFQYRAYDDFASSGVPIPPAGCGGSQSSACTTQALILVGVQVTNSAVPVPSASLVTYSWDGLGLLDRQVPGGTRHAATNVSDFSWYVDTSSGRPTVVVSLTVTFPAANSVGPGSAFLGDPYSESQTLRYYPRLIP